MGCCGSSAPKELTTDTTKKLSELKNLFVAGSIWTGTIKFGSFEEPWEIHITSVDKDGEIKAKRVDDFAKGTFIEAQEVTFDAEWDERDGEYVEVISFEWVDDDYSLFCDNLDGKIDYKERRLKGLAMRESEWDGDQADQNLPKRGAVDFLRVMAAKKYGADDVIHTVSFDYDTQGNDLHTKRIDHALKVIDKRTSQMAPGKKNLLQ